MATILALVDASLYAQSVCDLAAWAASRTGSDVRLLHVLGRREVGGSAPVDLSGSLKADARDALLDELAALDAERARLAQKRGRLLLEEAQLRVAKASDHPVETRLRHGDLLEEVAESEKTAALVIVGKRGEAVDFAKGHLGSNLERLVRASTRPVLVAARAFTPIRRVALAYDASPGAERALAVATSDPLLADLPIEVVSVGTEATTRAAAAAARLSESGRPATARALSGDPDEAIGAHVESNEIDLLVMGAYGHGRIRSLVVGSTTTATVRRCRIPVLMVR